MPFRAVLFDLDGTLLNTLEDLADAVNHVLSARGFPTHAVDAYRYLVGEGAKALVTRALPEAVRTAEGIAAALAGFDEAYRRNWKARTRPYEGVPEMLDALAARDLPMAVLSNKPHAFTVMCVEALLARWQFAAVLGQSDAIPPKPDPTGALQIAQQVAVPPGDFLYVGDTATDMRTAVRVGMVPVGVLWGFRTADELRENGAATLIERPEELIGLLG